ncbi:peptidyl-prolyl cis-trans isomerase sig-7-like isoform X2 [Artemia franciscana]|uniref:peptidyl-prolyl cis-trans isomerase sig-7-like isoform X2 n=1 Tax=Artemia franciscana TaxID=6661 RepID=UPI0032D9B6A3
MSVSFDTTLGRFTIDLFYVDSPKGCLNFMKLCKMKYYNFSLFHTVQHNFIAQAGDPTGTGKGGQSVYGLLYGEQAKYFEAELPPSRKHKSIGTVSLVNCGDKKFGSQFFITLAENLDSLDEEHCVIGQVMTGLDVITKLNEAICDKENRPYQDIRITHTVILDDPFPDPEGFLAPDRSPEPTREILQGGRIAPDEDINEFADRSQEEIEEYIKEKEAKAQATILEMIGDLPSVDVAPPENVLFVCKLNPVTTEDDLAIIFGRFGNIVSCEVIRDRETDKSLQYGFIEFDNPKSAEEAYFKMDNCLIDDRRIHVDFSQSVAHLKWRGKGKGGYAEDFDQDKFLEKRKRSKDHEKTKRKSEERRKKSSEDRQRKSSEERPRKSSEDRQRKSSEEREKSPSLTIKKPSRRSIRRRSESHENGRSLSRSPQKRRRSPSEHRRSPSYRRRRSPPRRSPPRQWRNDRYWNGGRRGRSPAYSRNMNDWRRSRRSPMWRERPTRYWDDRDRHDRDSRRRRSSERDYDRRRSADRVRKSPELEHRRRSESRYSKSRSITPDIKKRKYTESSKKKRRETSSESEKSVERSPSHHKGRRSRSRSIRKERTASPVPPAPVVEMTYDKFGFLGRKPPVPTESEKKEISAREKRRSRSRKRSVSRRKSPETRKKSLEPNVDKRRRRGSTPEGRRRRSPSREKARRRSRSRNRSVTPPRKRVVTQEKPKKAEIVKERRKKVETETEESSAESSAEEVRKKKKKKAKAKKKKSRKEASGSESSQEADSDSAESDSGAEERKKKKKSKKKKSKK